MKFPYTHKDGSVRVKIYRTSHARNGRPAYVNYCVAYYGSTGKLIRESSPTPEAALERAREVAGNLKQGRVVRAEISDADAAQFLAAKQIIGNRSLLSVCTEYMERLTAGSEIPIAAVIEEMLTTKAQEELSGRWLEDLEDRLAKFRAAFPITIGELSGPDIDDWLGSLVTESGAEVSPRTRKNFRTAIATLVSFAIRRKYLPREFADEMEAVGFRTAKSAPPEVYTPDEIKRLLDATARHRWQSVRETAPWLAVRAFAGVRHAEASRIHVSRDIHPEQGLIVLDSAITKTGASRSVPLQPNLLAWLKACDLFTGEFHDDDVPLTPNKHPDDSIRLVHTATGITPRHNGLRDSYVSYRMAIVGDVGKVAQETGHSAVMLQSKYRSVRLPDGALITRRVAEDYFSVMP